MDSNQRKQAILQHLKKANSPITGSKLSQIFNVTRQVIVADIALLRAKGEDITGTPQGYVYTAANTPKIRQKLATVHSRKHEDILDELYTIVDHGGAIQDVIVEHPLYGEIIASLHVSSRHDADQFILKLAQLSAEPLLTLTDGPHLHTVVADNMEVIERIKKSLRKKGYLAEEV